MTVYNRLEKDRIALKMIKEISEPFVKLNKHSIRSIAESFHRRPLRIVDVDPYDNRTFAIILNMDYLGANDGPIGYAIYVSTQRSPIRPYQVWPKARKLRNIKMKYNGNIRMIKVMIANKYTCGAVRELRKHGIMAFRKISELKDFVAKYIAKRYKGLLASISGKIVYSKVALLILALAYIQKALGIKPELFNPLFESKLLQAVYGTPTTIQLT